MRTRRLILLVLLVTLAFPVTAWLIVQPCLAADFTGRVVGIIDGDTIEVLHNHRAEPIRLNGIDCPEKRQAYGQKAKDAVADLTFRKEVTVQTHGRDKYKRTIGEVTLPDGVNLNQELVKQGWCWWYRKYAPADTVLEGLERKARDGQKGLWADPHPVPPWVYRKARRGQALDRSDLVPPLNHRSYSPGLRCAWVNRVRETDKTIWM